MAARRSMFALLATGTLLTGIGFIGGCTAAVSPAPGVSLPPSAVALTPASLTASASVSSTAITPTPVTPAGLATGPGVDDTTITLGMLVSAAADRGFSTGARLWQHTVNTTGGVCGRSVNLSASEPTEALTSAYTRLATSTLGLLTQPTSSESTELASLSTDDQLPVLTPSGSSADLAPFGPVVVGATDDIKAINALAYLRSTGGLATPATVGVYNDGGAAARNATLGANWWASRSNASVVVVDSPEGSADWGSASAVLAFTTPAHVSEILAATPPSVTVITDLAGYDPAAVGGDGKRLLVTLETPPYGAGNPAATAVVQAFAAASLTDPGPALLSGYGVAAEWGRILTRACADRSLTRTGLWAAMAALAPAPAESLFGRSSLAQVTQFELPATRASSIAAADPAAPTGLRQLIWLQAAVGIADYTPGG